MDKYAGFEKPLRVSIASSRIRRGPRLKTNVYFSSLPSSYTTADLIALCQSYGRIIGSRVLVNPVTGLSRRYGFVRYDSHENASKAIDALNGQFLPNQREPLVVKFARDPSDPDHPSQLQKQREGGGYEQVDSRNFWLMSLPNDPPQLAKIDTTVERSLSASFSQLSINPSGYEGSYNFPSPSTLQIPCQPMFQGIYKKGPPSPSGNSVASTVLSKSARESTGTSSPGNSRETSPSSVISITTDFSQGATPNGTTRFNKGGRFNFDVHDTDPISSDGFQDEQVNYGSYLPSPSNCYQGSSYLPSPSNCYQPVAYFFPQQFVSPSSVPQYGVPTYPVFVNSEGYFPYFSESFPPVASLHYPVLESGTR